MTRAPKAPKPWTVRIRRVTAWVIEYATFTDGTPGTSQRGIYLSRAEARKNAEGYRIHFRFQKSLRKVSRPAARGRDGKGRAK